MNNEQNPINHQYEIEPFYKRIFTNTVDWFVTKGKRIKERFIKYFTSKETWKIWRRRLIVIGVILVIALSFRVKEYFDLYPYDKSSYLVVTPDRTNVTNYSGSTDYSRLETFKKNTENGIEDDIRMTSTINGYTVVEDLSLVIENGVSKIRLVTDNTKNKMLDKSQRIKVTKEYKRFKYELINGVRHYTLEAEDGTTYVLATRVLYS